MTESIAELIAEALEEPTFGPGSDHDSAQYWANLSHKMARALEQQAEERDALAAQIEAAREYLTKERWDDPGFDPVAILTADPAPFLDEVRAQAIETAIDGAVLMMGDSGVTVYDNREHYEQGRPRPLPIREWLAAKAAALRTPAPTEMKEGDRG